MLVYEHKRTENIVSRLVRLAGIFRLLIIISCVLIWAAGLGYLTNQLLDGAWFIGAMVGVILGYLLGMLEAALVVTLLEWSSQMLVSQGEIIRRFGANK